jgi:DNA-binding Lrp family transcriptional regulator
LAQKKLDPVDLKILEILTENARLDFKEISNILGISDRTVARRIEELERSGIIKGYSVRISEKLMNFIVPKEKKNMVEPTISEWESLRDSLTQIFGAGSSPILFSAGYGIGKDYAERIKASQFKKEEQLFLFTRFFEERGWGRMSFESIDLQHVEGTTVLTDSYFKKKSRGPACYEIRGIIAAFLESIFNRKVSVSEEKCVRKGDDHCEFRFKGEEKAK